MFLRPQYSNKTSCARGRATNKSKSETVCSSNIYNSIGPGPGILYVRKIFGNTALCERVLECFSPCDTSFLGQVSKSPSLPVPRCVLFGRWWVDIISTVTKKDFWTGSSTPSISVPIRPGLRSGCCFCLTIIWIPLSEKTSYDACLAQRKMLMVLRWRTSGVLSTFCFQVKADDLTLVTDSNACGSSQHGSNRYDSFFRGVLVLVCLGDLGLLPLLSRDC